MSCRSKFTAAAVAMLLASVGLSAQAQEAEHVDPARLNAHIAALADDAMGGRGPTTPGEELAVTYVADQFKAMGLEPAGDNGGWFQTVPINRFLQDGPATLSAKAGRETMTFQRGTDIIVGSHRPVSHITLTDTPVVFVGYGVTAPERGWDDFKGVDVRGKIVLMLVNDPDFEVAADSPVAGKFDGKGMTYYGRWVYKFEEAARRGAGRPGCWSSTRPPAPAIPGPPCRTPRPPPVSTSCATMSRPSGSRPRAGSSSPSRLA